MDIFPLPLLHTLIIWGTVVLQVVAVVLFILLFTRETKVSLWVGKNALALSFILVLSAVLGSLYYSAIVGIVPCVLCWWQRVFMVPLIFLFGSALYRKQTGMLSGARILSFVGGGIALYHILLPLFESIPVICDVASTASCIEQPIMALGYITIPVMSLTVFIMLILFTLHARKTAALLISAKS
ncbi:MAG: disulfide bond formation protein B [Patescibacteria group bacterium]